MLFVLSKGPNFLWIDMGLQSYKLLGQPSLQG